jgi:hypothetical protein
VIADVMKYLTDRAHGKAQQPLSGDSDVSPVAFQVVLVDAREEET